jgi:cell division protein FtsW (lipid II flippase)
MRWGSDNARRKLLLDESQQYALPSSVGGGYLEYRYDRWQRYNGSRWLPLSSSLTWGKPPRVVQRERTPSISFRPHIEIGISDAPCRWPLNQKAIPAGLELGQLARLAFDKGRLSLQHLGALDTPLQIVPASGSPRHLGTATLFSGDYISLGQLTYRVTITKERIRLMLTRSPQRYILPLAFFASYPSENLPMRKLIPNQRKLLITGGEGADRQTERWRIPLSLKGIPGKTQLRHPHRPFLALGQTSSNQLNVTPAGKSKVYLASTDGTLQPKALTKTQTLPNLPQIIYSKRLYVRVFRPSYAGLTFRIGLIWIMVAGGCLWFFVWLLRKGHVPLRLQPLARPFATTPTEPGETNEPTTGKGWLFFALLLPLALFLNGMGLYVVAAVSLSSLGLNNHAFLYRQILWSLVGVMAFVAVVSWSPEMGAALRERLGTWPFIGRLFRWWQQRKENAIQGVHVLGQSQAPTLSRQALTTTTMALGLVAIAAAFLLQRAIIIVPFFVLYGYGLLLHWEWQRSHYHPKRRQSLRMFFLTLLLLGVVPVVGLLLPPLVHNRFFLKVPGIGTVKLSEFAILAAIAFFAHFLGIELFALRNVKAHKQPTNAPQEPSEHTQESTLTSDTQEAEPETSNASDTPNASATIAEQPGISLPLSEASHKRHRLERLGGALSVSFLYLLLLGAIGLLYTAQGDLGPGLILTLCFSLYLLFSFSGSGADRMTTLGNLLRIGIVFGGLLLLIWLPSMLLAAFPEWTQSSAELQKVQERLALWKQPWRFIVGEQILQNLWNLSSHRGAFQWFNNLHSDFVLTAIVGVLSPLWGFFVIGVALAFPMASLVMARQLWHPISRYDSLEVIGLKERDTIRSLVILFGGIYLFAQNFIHIGSVLRLTPMTGVTFTWVSSGGTSVVVCYLVLAMMFRQLRADKSVTDQSSSIS